MGLTRTLFRQFILELRRDGVVPVVFVIPSREMQTNFPLAGRDVLGWGAYSVDGRTILAPGDYFERDTHWRPMGQDKVARAFLPLIVAAADSAHAPRAMTSGRTP